MSANTTTHEIAYSKGGLVFFLMLCISLHTIDATIVNVALPMMQGSLQATFDQVSWVVTTYILATVMLTPLVSWASSRFGFKRLLILSVIIFTISSVFCGLALTLESMLAARALQGASGAPLIPLALATINRLTRTREERAKLMALFGLGTMAGPVLGPSIGGYITEVATWRWVFFINLPVGILAVIGLGLTMRPGSRIPGHKLNLTGFTALALAVGCIQLALDRGESEDWFQSYEIIGYAIISIIAIWVFAVNSRTSKTPFLPGELFKNRNYVIGMFMVLITAGNMTVSVVLQPPMMQNLMGYGVVDTGNLLMWRGIGMMIGMVLTPRLTRFINMQTLVICGSLLMVSGVYPFMFLTAETPAITLAIPPIFHGFGIGMLFVMASTTAYATIPDHLQVDASSVFSLVRGLGQAVSVSIVVSMVSRFAQVNHSELSERLTPYNTFNGNALFQQGSINATQNLAMSDLILQREAAMIAYNNAYAVLLMAALSVIVMALFMKTPPEQSLNQQEHPVEA